MTALPRLACTGAALAALLWGWRSPAAASPAGSDYVGVSGCRDCHAEIYDSWNSTAHARATASLGRRSASGCVGCHTTGDQPATERLRGVQCEACHGPGAGYSPDDVMRSPALASALGLVDLSTPERRHSVCTSCHRSGTRIQRFDVEAAWRRIQHGSSR